ncbi:hypothetical protein F183_A13920 [Bryobacterales bacterium F-183]|nr:hypothetical protein F183_A13920 [Bryobacterales bacterium F-183]
MTPSEQAFIGFSCNKLTQLTERIGVCLGKLTDDQVWARGSENSNAIGNLVLHLCGNVRQWIGHGVGGSADVRERDAEFNAQGGVSVAELQAKLQATVADAVATIRSLTSEDLIAVTHVQNYDVPKIEAIYHVVQHFAEHTGQIIFATKFLTGQELGFYTHLKNPKHGETTP